LSSRAANAVNLAALKTRTDFTARDGSPATIHQKQFSEWSNLGSPTKGDMRWYANVDGRNLGPYQRSDVERMIQQGQLLEKDYLRTEAGAEWVEARNDATFRHLFSDYVDVSAILPKSPSEISSTGIKVYHAKPVDPSRK
jgi:hypothetical protein